MTKILLVCAAGMSTSMLVERMKKAATAKGIEAKIEAHPAPDFDAIFRDWNVILLGPQIRFQKANWAPKAAEAGIPLDVINTMDYGMMNGEKVLDHALKMATAK